MICKPDYVVLTKKLKPKNTKKEKKSSKMLIESNVFTKFKLKLFYTNYSKGNTNIKLQDSLM